MDDLSLVGVHDDGEHLLIAGPNGQRYRLKVDDALRAAVRRDRARLSQLQVQSENRLRPREIQARIRAGETAEEVAESAGLSLDHVRRYEGPVLAEREYVADQARQVRVQRGGSGMTLGETVTDRLQQREVDVEQLTWDAWRGDDGSWTVALDFAAGSKVRQARWTYHPTVRHVSAQDDEARWLIDDEPERSADGRRRLAPVRDRVFDVEAPMAPPPRAIPDEPGAVDLLDTLRERRGRRNRPLTEDEELAGAPDPVREAIDSLLSRADAMGEPPAAHPARSRPQEAIDGEVLLLPEQLPIHTGEDDESPEPPEPPAPPTSKKRPAKRAPRGRSNGGNSNGTGSDAGSGSATAEPAPAEAEPATTGAGSHGTARKQRRASVPSWDDIVFGQRRD